MARNERFEVVDIGGMAIATASRAELVSAMLQDSVRRHIQRVRPKVVVDANGHAISLRATDPAYRSAVDAADIIHADGGFLVTLSRLTRNPIPERSATTDFIHDASAAAAAHGVTFYLLGGTEEVNRACASVLETTYAGLRIVGRHHGFFNDLDDVAADIDASKPDVVWIGMGKPTEQVLAIELRERIDAAWIVTCGGCFNFVTGAYGRAPQWMQSANLEWLHRLATNPRKLFWRYVVSSPHALLISVASLWRAHRARRIDADS